MNDKYDRCKSCDRLLKKIKSKRQYRILCPECAKGRGHILNQKIFTEGFKPSVYVEEEAFFEDDPRALKEKDYRRHIPNVTHVRTKVEYD